ncbi:MAG: hypothetical protein H0U66_06190 [Gemmatimonadaceae bacterium]|nr:hypothetical protein [Gemmatimonadaceae bacterium]
MGDAFTRCSVIGDDGVRRLAPFFDEQFASWRLRPDLDYQFSCGDAEAVTKDGTTVKLEIKTLKTSDDFPAETWSHRRIQRVGWLLNKESNANTIYVVHFKLGIFWEVPFAPLQKFAFSPAFARYREVPVLANAIQRNDTYLRWIPYTDLQAVIPRMVCRPIPPVQLAAQ